MSVDGQGLVSSTDSTPLEAHADLVRLGLGVRELHERKFMRLSRNCSFHVDASAPRSGTSSSYRNGRPSPF